MIINKRKKQRRYVGKGFYWIMAAFFVVIFLSVLIHYYFYYNVIMHANNEIENNYIAEYQNGLEHASLFVEEFYNIGNEIVKGTDLETLAGKSVMDDLDMLASFQNLFIRRYSLDTSSMRHIPYLYLKKSGFTLGQRGLSDAYASGVITDILDFSPEIWDEVKNPGEDLLCQIIKTDKMNFARLTLSREIYHDVVFVYCMEVPLVQKIIGKYFLPEGSQSFLMDALNSTVNLSEMPGFAGKYTYDAINDMPDGASIEYADAEYTIYHAKISGEELQYIVLIPETLKDEQMSVIRNVVLFTVIIWICVGGALAYILSKRLYQPVSKMIETIITSTGNDNDIYKHSEFRFISNEMNSLIEKTDDYEKKLESQQQLLTENMLARVLKNRTLGIDNIQETLEQHDIMLQDKRYAVFVIKVDDHSGLLMLSQEETQAEYLFRFVYPVLKQSCLNFMRDEGFLIKLTEEDGYIFGIAIFEEGDLAGFETASNKLIAYIMKEMNIVVSVFISDTRYSIDDIHSGYQQAMELMSYNAMINRISVAEAYQTTKEKNENYSYEARFVDDLKIMLNYISCKNFADAKRAIEKLYREAFFQREISVHTIKSQVMIITNVFVMAVKGISDLDHAFLDGLNCSNRMSAAVKLPDLLEQSAFILEKINEVYRETKNNARNTNRIVAFINENYYKNDLSAGMIAERFLINTSTLSRIIKKEANMGFLDYVNILRIKKAKTLIKTTSLPLNDIAESVGYTNALTMTRAFKKLEGITPGSLRKIG